MKKILLIIIALTACARINAQELPSDFYGIKIVVTRTESCDHKAWKAISDYVTAVIDFCNEKKEPTRENHSLSLHQAAMAVVQINNELTPNSGIHIDVSFFNDEALATPQKNLSPIEMVVTFKPAKTSQVNKDKIGLLLSNFKNTTNWVPIFDETLQSVFALVSGEAGLYIHIDTQVNPNTLI